MNIIEIFQSFQTQEQSLEYLEKIRWSGKPVCPYCGSLSVGRHASSDRHMTRWQCRECARAFSVTVGTVFHGTHVPLRNWFLVLALMLRAKKSASAYQIARDLDMRRPTVWSMMQRIRSAMAANPDQERLLYDIVEVNEAYIDGQPRNGRKRDDEKSSKREQGTKKVALIRTLGRGGKFVARVANPSELSVEGIAKFMARFIVIAKTTLLANGYKEYSRTDFNLAFSESRRMFVGAVT